MTGKLDLAILALVGRLGAASAGHVGASFALTPTSAQRRLRRLSSIGMLTEIRLIHGQAPLYLATRQALRATGLIGLEPCRLSPASIGHIGACSTVAVELQAALPTAALMTERELRAWERASDEPPISAELRIGGPAVMAPRHRPDLVAWPTAVAAPVAIEVELTIKSAQRLRTIVRGWARSRSVGGAVYHASPPASGAVRRAIADERAEDRVRVCQLGDTGHLVELVIAAGRRSTSPVPSAA